jgi:uncharacterized protein (DUF1015 family)
MLAQIAPLTPLRYDLARLTGGLASVVSPPYDVISADQRAVLAARDPYNIVRLILPDGDSDSKYANAAALLALWRERGILVRDPEPAFYRFDQTFAPPGAPSPARVRRRGFLALVKLVPFASRIVLPHERTLSGPKEDRLRLFRTTGANLSPGFMLYRDPRGELDGPLEEAERLAEYSTSDGVEHVLAKVREKSAVRAIVEGVARSNLLIADGHHRYETALRYSEEVSAAHPEALATAEHRFFMTFLVSSDDPNLVVFPTHRHVHSLPSFSFDELIRHARETFAVDELPRGADAALMLEALRRAAATGSPSVAAAAADGRSVVLRLRDDIDLDRHPTLGSKPKVLRGVDAVVLHAGVLEHILGISPGAQAAKTNLSYPQDALAALAELRSGRGNVLFLMNATPVAQVRDVAEAGEVMPQKSTFFYPKVPTGLAIHTLDPSRQVSYAAATQL